MLCYIFGKLLTILDFNIYLFLFSVVISVWEDCIHISSNFLTCYLVVLSLLMDSLKAFFIYITVFLISRISVWFLRVSISLLLLSISSCILSTFFNETLNTQLFQIPSLIYFTDCVISGSNFDACFIFSDCDFSS